MLHFVSIIAITAFAMLGQALVTVAEAAEPAQRWAQIKEESGMQVAGGTGSIEVTNFVSDVYFDPTDLKNSKMTLAAAFVPAGVNAQGGGVFQWNFNSSSIRKIGEGAYEAKGEIQTNKGKRMISVPFSVQLTADSKLRIDGRVTIVQGEFNFGADSVRYPAQMAAAFRVAAKPLFSGPGIFTLE